MWAEAFARALPLLAAHIQLAAAAMLLGLVIAIPAGVFAARHPRFGRAVLGFASLVQTIPSLALLALFYPMLLALSVFVRVSALGFLPSLLALGLYALLPILRNTMLGLRGVDQDVIAAADGIGMTGWQKLILVEAPLALPVIMGGVRTAAVWTIGAATLSTTVGQSSLGDIIFSGLQTQNWVLVLTGCIIAAALSLIVDSLLAVAEHGIDTRKLWLWIAPVALLIIVPVTLALWPHPHRPVVTIGAKSFSEQYILARLIGRRLEASGFAVRYQENLGSAVVFDALGQGDVDVYVDYAGTLWTNAMKRTDNLPKPAMDAAVGAWALQSRQVLSLGALGFENAYALAMSGDAARAAGIKTIDDLAAKAPDLVFGADLEFLDRPEWAALRRAYRLNFKATRSFSPTFLYDAVASGDADVISAFSSDGRVAAQGLAVLTDPKNAIPSYDALLLIGPKASHDAKLVAALRPLIGAIAVITMQRANLMVDGTEKASPDSAAAWLDSSIRMKGKP